MGDGDVSLVNVVVARDLLVRLPESDGAMCQFWNVSRSRLERYTSQKLIYIGEKSIV